MSFANSPLKSKISQDFKELTVFNGKLSQKKTQNEIALHEKEEEQFGCQSFTHELRWGTRQFYRLNDTSRVLAPLLERVRTSKDQAVLSNTAAADTHAQAAEFFKNFKIKHADHSPLAAEEFEQKQYHEGNLKKLSLQAIQDSKLAEANQSEASKHIIGNALDADNLFVRLKKKVNYVTSKLYSSGGNLNESNNQYEMQLHEKESKKFNTRAHVHSALWEGAWFERSNLDAKVPTEPKQNSLRSRDLAEKSNKLAAQSHLEAAGLALGFKKKYPHNAPMSAEDLEKKKTSEEKEKTLSWQATQNTHSADDDLSKADKYIWLKINDIKAGSVK